MPSKTRSVTISRKCEYSYVKDSEEVRREFKAGEVLKVVRRKTHYDPEGSSISPYFAEVLKNNQHLQ